MKTIYILNCTNCDGNYVCHKWENKPTEKELILYLSDYHDDAEAIAKNLLRMGEVGLSDSASTIYELTTI